jgi:hypothetical protein
MLKIPTSGYRTEAPSVERGHGAGWSPLAVRGQPGRESGAGGRGGWGVEEGGG